MPSVDAVYTNCEDIEPHEGHPLGGDEYCIGVSASDGSVETLSDAISRIQHDQHISTREAVRVTLAELRFKEAISARQRSSVQADNEGQLGTDS